MAQEWSSVAQARQALNSAQSKRAPFTGAMNFVRMEAALDGGSAEHPVNGLAEGMTAGITGTAKWQVLEENSLRPRPPKVRAQSLLRLFESPAVVVRFES